MVDLLRGVGAVLLELGDELGEERAARVTLDRGTAIGGCALGARYPFPPRLSRGLLGLGEALLCRGALLRSRRTGLELDQGLASSDELLARASRVPVDRVDADSELVLAPGKRDELLHRCASWLDAKIHTENDMGERASRPALDVALAKRRADQLGLRRQPTVWHPKLPAKPERLRCGCAGRRARSRRVMFMSAAE